MWGKQWGTVGEEWAGSVAVDGQGNVYVSGSTEGNLFGKNQGGNDIFVIKLDSNGQVLWSKQFGTLEDDGGPELCVDALGNVYMTTATRGSWFGKNSGGRDIVLLKLSNDGQLIWGKQLGTEGDEVATGIAVDSQGYVYVVGITTGNLFKENKTLHYEGFLVKFASSGELIWGRQFENSIFGVTIDNQEKIYIIGEHNSDSLIAKFTSDGVLVWKQVISGKSTEEGKILESERFNSIKLYEDGNIYVTGAIDVWVDENALVSISDAFIAKHSGNDGKRIWVRRIKSEGEGETPESFEDENEFWDVAIDEQGNAYAIGFEGGGLSATI